MHLQLTNISLYHWSQIASVTHLKFFSQSSFSSLSPPLAQLVNTSENGVVRHAVIGGCGFDSQSRTLYTNKKNLTVGTHSSSAPSLNILSPMWMSYNILNIAARLPGDRRKKKPIFFRYPTYPSQNLVLMSFFAIKLTHLPINCLLLFMTCFYFFSF